MKQSHDYSARLIVSPFLSRSALLLFIIVLIPSVAGTQVLLKGPWLLYSGSNMRMDVLWQNDSQSVDTIRWGSDTTFTSGSDTSTPSVPGFLHRYTFMNLVPGERYVYRLTVGTVSYEGSFVAAPPADKKDLKFFVYGDTRTYPSIHNRIADSVCSVFRRDPEFQTLILSVGDIVADGNQESYWTNELFSKSFRGISAMMASIPFTSCRGNHEGTAVLFGKYFPSPYVQARYWSFDYGPAHIAVVDQYAPYGTGSAQLQWLDADLAATDRPWKFILLHEPGWSAAGGHANSAGVQQYIEPLCEKYNVPIVFAGHNHYYARADVQGLGGMTVRHITTGGGGAPLHTPLSGQPDIVATASINHYCTVEISGDTLLQFRAISINGSPIDEFTVIMPPPLGIGPENPSGNYPAEFQLHPAYPNPLNPAATLRYDLPVESAVRISIFDILGRNVSTLVDNIVPAGEHIVRWKPSGNTSGVYFCRMEAVSRVIPFRTVSVVRSLMLIK